MKIAQSLNIGQEAVKQGLPGSTGYDTANPGASFAVVLGAILSGIMAVAALMVLLYLILGAISWITSGGDKAKVENARAQMTNAVIGLLVLSSVLAIFTLLQGFLGLELFTFI